MHRRWRGDGGGGGARLVLPIDPAIHSQLIAAVERCAVPATEVNVTYEDDLQSELIFVKSKSLTDEQLGCLANIRSKPPYAVILFENPDVTRRSFEIEKQEGRKSAREWLLARGLLDKLPLFEPARESVAAYARRLETFCGIRPGAILELHPSGDLRIKSDWAQSQLRGTAPEVPEGSFWCLLNAMSASNLEEHGVKAGIIGNAAIASEKP